MHCKFDQNPSQTGLKLITADGVRKKKPATHLYLTPFDLAPWMGTFVLALGLAGLITAVSRVKCFLGDDSEWDMLKRGLSPPNWSNPIPDDANFSGAGYVVPNGSLLLFMRCVVRNVCRDFLNVGYCKRK